MLGRIVDNYLLGRYRSWTRRNTELEETFLPEVPSYEHYNQSIKRASISSDISIRASSQNLPNCCIASDSIHGRYDARMCDP